MIETSDKNNPLGEIKVSIDVIEVIVGIATFEVDGVYGMQANLSSDIRTIFGRSEHSKGVFLNADEYGVSVDVYCYFNYGVNVPKVANEIQENVKNQVYYMTEIELNEVNIHIAGIIPEKSQAVDVLTATDLNFADET